jgi:Flp pilus assembly pilin Flp
MSFFRHEDGQSWLEFALVLVLIAIVIIAILTLLGPQINSAIEWLRETIPFLQ